MERVCEHCGKPFEASNLRGPKPKYCCEECRRLADNERRKARTEEARKARIPRQKRTSICVVCGQSFVPKGKWNKCCGPDCTRILKSQNTKKQYATCNNYTCLNCGKRYKAKEKRRDKFCSRECAFEYKRAKPKELACYSKICAKCNQPFTSRQPNAKYCQKCKENKTSLCEVCGKEFVSKTKGRKLRCCSTKCYRKTETFLNGKREYKRKRRASKRTKEVEVFSSNEIFERDGWICQLCDKPIKRDAKCPHFLSATIDHIIPLARGGSHTRKNVQCAHFICNCKKSDKVDE